MKILSKLLHSEFLKNFITCGILGWCLEIFFTAMTSLRRRNLKLKGETSLWMFPIYGSAALLLPVFRLLKGCSVFFRGTVYAALIYLVEYISGYFLWSKGICPWDYGKTKWHIHRVIRLDYLPCWFIVGLLFERILAGKSQSFPSSER